MKKDWLVKTFALCVVVLFISVNYQPIIAEKTTSFEKTSDYNNVDFEEAKEYLFQTLIDISNNLEVKQFLNEYKKDLITNNNNNYDFRNAIQKIYKQNPKLLKSILFTKPEMTIEYLETNYNKGLEIVDILGEEESLKLLESVKTNPELLNGLKNVILNDKKLSNRVSVLEEMNNDVKSKLNSWEFPIICFILNVLDLPFGIFYSILVILWVVYFYFDNSYPILVSTLFLLWLLLTPFVVILNYPIVFLAALLNCW